MPGMIPIIRIGPNLLVSIQIELTDLLVRELKDDVAAVIERTAAGGLVIEVSGVDILDSYLARSIRDLSLIARLMGVRTVLAGLNPAMAMTLVEMGMLMQGVTTATNLDAALALLAAAAVAAGEDDQARLAAGRAEDDEALLAAEVWEEVGDES